MDKQKEFEKAWEDLKGYDWVNRETFKVGFFAAWDLFIKKHSDLKFQRDSYKKAAEAWMNDYQALKDKYEPMELVLSNAIVNPRDDSEEKQA
jgi:hypothetical protein